MVQADIWEVIAGAQKYMAKYYAAALVDTSKHGTPVLLHAHIHCGYCQCADHFIGRIHVMMTRIRNKRGESYIDVAVTILVVSFVLIFMVNIVSFVALNQNMKTAADRIAEYASMNGTTDIVKSFMRKIMPLTLNNC